MTDDAERYVGFHSYADGAPRGEEDVPAFRTSDVRVETPAAAEAPPAWRRALLVLTAGAGLTAVAAFGWTLRTAPQTEDASPRAFPGVQVLVRDPPLAPLPETAPLDVVPATPPPAAPASPQTVQTPPPAQAAQSAEIAAAANAIAAPRPASATPPSPQAEASVREAAPESRQALRPAPPPRNRFDDCADAPSLAQQMVCDDRRLAAADQRMKAAYAAALDAGVPYRALARDQADWMEVREDAAEVSRRAVLDLYRQRTQELWDLARGVP